MVDETSAPSRNLTQTIGLYLGIGLFLIVILFFDLEPGKPIVTRMAAVAALMAVWWITDTIPLFGHRQTHRFRDLVHHGAPPVSGSCGRYLGDPD